MTNGLLLYCLFVAIFLDIFYLAHRYIFTKYSFLKWDRFYFLSIIIFAFILPIIHISSIFELNIDKVITQKTLSRIDFTQGLITIRNDQSTYNLIHLFYFLNLVYFIGFVSKLLFFVWDIIKIRKQTLHPIPVIVQNIKVYKCRSKEIAFTLFNKIYVSEYFFQLPEDSHLKILGHEQVHSHQQHTIDIVLFSLISIILWFNPLNRSILKTIKSIHEFLADEAVISKENPQDYMQLLLKMATNKKAWNLSSAFSGIDLKKRILIMKRYTNEQRQKRLFLFFIPILVLILFALTLFSPFMRANPILGNSEFVNPFGDNYQVLAPYFEVRNTSNRLRMKHSCISVRMKDYSPLLAVSDGIILSSDSLDNWGVTEFFILLACKRYQFKYQGLEKSLVVKNQLVKKGDTIGYSGKLALYPKIDFTVYKAGEEIAPRKIIKF